MGSSAPFLLKSSGSKIDRKIIDSITRLHRAGKPIYAWSVGMDAGICPSDVSRWFRDHGIFWDVWRKEWVCVIPGMMGDDVAAKIPAGSIKPATWIMGGNWLRSAREEATR